MQVQVKETQPLSRRMRINVAAAANAVQAGHDVHAAPHGTSRSVHAFIVFLDWFGEPCASAHRTQPVISISADVLPMLLQQAFAGSIAACL